jgi:hypothetical protein
MAVDFFRTHSYTVSVRNITVSLDDESYRRARIVAAERGTSVSALVKQFLAGLSREADEKTELKQAEETLREEITRFRAGDRLSRDEIHARKT